MFFAAFMSRSCVVPHASQVHERSFKVSVSFTVPHELHVLLLGSNRPIFIRFLPAQSHLYANIRTNSDQPASRIDLFKPDFADCPFGCATPASFSFFFARFDMLLTPKSSTQKLVAWFSLTNFVLSF